MPSHRMKCQGGSERNPDGCCAATLGTACTSRLSPRGSEAEHLREFHSLVARVLFCLLF